MVAPKYGGAVAIQCDKIFDFLSTVEGELATVGYIPCNLASGGTGNFTGAAGQDPANYMPMGVSGVTIGVGVDLGQQSEGELSGWGLPDDVLSMVRPYIGMKKKAAVAALAAAPLTLSAGDAQELTDCEHRGYMADIVVPWWDGREERCLDYEALPWQAQAVVFSMAYQLGISGMQRRGPNTVAALLAGNWARASACLLDSGGWGGEYVSRRAAEGRLLREIV